MSLTQHIRSHLLLDRPEGAWRGTCCRQGEGFPPYPEQKDGDWTPHTKGVPLENHPVKQDAADIVEIRATSTAKQVLMFFGIPLSFFVFF